MAWSLIANHTTKDQNTVASSSLAFTSNNDPSSEGNHIIIVSGRFGNSGATFGCSDTAGNTYTPVTAQASNSYQIDSGNAQTDCCFLFWAPVTHSNVANTVTVTAKTGGSHRFTWAIAEFAPGTGTTVSLDAGPATTQFGAGTTAFNVASVTTTGTSDLVFVVVQADSTQATGFTNNAPWTAFEGTSYAATNRAVGQYQLNVGAASYTGSITATTGSSGSGIIIAFKAVASASSYLPQLMTMGMG